MIDRPLNPHGKPRLKGRQSKVNLYRQALGRRSFTTLPLLLTGLPNGLPHLVADKSHGLLFPLVLKGEIDDGITDLQFAGTTSRHIKEDNPRELLLHPPSEFL